jgi:hypothetical protein
VLEVLPVLLLLLVLLPLILEVALVLRRMLGLDSSLLQGKRALVPRWSNNRHKA